MRKPESEKLAESARSLLRRALDLAASPLGRLQSGAGTAARRGVAVAVAAAVGLVAGWLVWPSAGQPGEGSPVVVAEARATSAPSLVADASSILVRNPLGIELEPRPLAPTPPPAPVAPPPAAKPEPTGPVRSVGLKLLGTMVSGSLGCAIIQEPGGKSDVYSVGQTVSGRTITAVARKRVVLKNGSGLEVLELPEDGSSDGIVTPASPAFAPPTPAFAEPSVASAEPPQPALPVQSLSRELPRDEVVRNLGNPASFLSQVSAEPYYENGRFAGYYVQNVKPGSYASSLGIRNGDILETVNGELIDTVQKAFRLLGLVQRAPEMDVMVRRDGERMQMCFRMQ